MGKLFSDEDVGSLSRSVLFVRPYLGIDRRKLKRLIDWRH